MKNHLKRIASPRTWIVNRKENVFIVKPNPGAHKLENGLALGVILRDVLSLATKMSEVKKLLHNNEVLIDGRRRKDHRYIVGLFDVISIPSITKAYRVVLDEKGRLVVVEIPTKEAEIKPCKIVGKTVLGKGKIQFNLHDGKNILGTHKAKVGDTFLLKLPSLEVEEVISLEPKVTVFLTKGKHAGSVGELKEIMGKEAIYVVDKKEIETAKAYLFIVGKKQSLITLTKK